MRQENVSTQEKEPYFRKKRDSIFKNTLYLSRGGKNSLLLIYNLASLKMYKTKSKIVYTLQMFPLTICKLFFQNSLNSYLPYLHLKVGEYWNLQSEYE